MTPRVDITSYRADLDAWETELSRIDPPHIGDDRESGGGGGDDSGANNAHGNDRLDRVILAVLAIVCLAAMFVSGIAVGVLWL
jgi:hypothetical protein